MTLPVPSSIPGSALRNRGPIADVLATVLPAEGLVLEVASGSGAHVAHFAERFGGLTFVPSELEAEARAGVDARTEGLSNVRPSIAIDATADAWPIERADAVVCINMIQAAPLEAIEGLMRGAARLLAPGAPLVTYGPYKIGGQFSSEGDVELDQWLKRERHPSFGIRDLEVVLAAAERAGFALERRVAMPANNFMLIFRRQPAT